MYALNCIIVDPSGSYRVFDGTIHSLPFELKSLTRVKQVILTSKPGWSLDDWGYFSYSLELPSAEKIIVFGLMLDGETPRKKVQGYSQRFSKNCIEKFAQGFFTAATDAHARSQVEVNNLIHDLRSLSTTIYHSANEADIFLNQGNFDEAQVRLNNIEAAQGILKIRIDAYDYLANINSLRSIHSIAVFRKVDKVVRFLKPNAAESKKTIRLLGLSYRKVLGPDLFELIPYPIIDNAIKYSPPNSLITVDVQEESVTRIMITSLGPRITRAEQETIFSRGSRGEGAIATGLPGTGLGLHVAHRIAQEAFSGSIRVQQSPSVANVDGQAFYETTFTIELPTVA